MELKLKRNYLTSQEIIGIIVDVLPRQSYFEQKVVKLALVAQILIEDFPKFETCDEIYDYLMENNIDLYSLVYNIKDIDEHIDKEFGIEKTISNFLKDIENKLEELEKNIDITQMSSLIEQLKEIPNGNAV